MSNKKAEKVLKRAYALRDFEITHYWKRAQYFWGFLAVIFAGFFLALSKYSEHPLYKEFILIINSLGIIFSYSWYLINRGSKKWQQHWENVIMEYEEILERPLYGKVANVQNNIFNAGNFSVSRINIFISIVVLLFWICAWIFTSLQFENAKYPIQVGLATLILLFLNYFLGKSKK